MVDVDEINRLMGLGLPVSVALEVIAGTRNEESEVARWGEYREAREWAADPANRSIRYTPKWDCDPSKFHLALDGASQHRFNGEEVAVIEADVDDVLDHLHFGSDRDEDPWSERYGHKTTMIAYRWANDRPVTPPLITHCDGEISLDGGMHRFHLAKYYGADRMPFVVRQSDLSRVQAILSSAKTCT